MSYDEAKVWIDAAQFLWIIGATVWAFWGDRHAVIRAKLAQHVQAVSDLTSRTIRLEEAAKHAPTHEDLSKLHEKLNSVSTIVERIGGDVRACRSEVGSVRDLISPLQSTIQMVNEYLLSQNKP